jgi:hypothetical protein
MTLPWKRKKRKKRKPSVFREMDETFKAMCMQWKNPIMVN